MSTLYRKYRPQKFSDLVGQEHLVQTLTNEISTGKIAHAYLFSGPRGIGKTTMARLFAKAINCENRKEGSFEPCNECSSCQEITNGRNIDVIEIDAASHTGVDSVRENIIDNAQFKPTRSKYKVFIIDEVHMLSTSAFNALLKTLEEPPAHVIFILATTEMQKLPATIISRCQRFNFKKINNETVFNKLQEIAEQEGIKIDKAVLEKIINKSDGCLRDAESLLGQIMSLNLKKIKEEDADLFLPVSDFEQIFDYLDAIADNNAALAIKAVDNIIKEGANLEQFALDLLETLRAVMIVAAGGTPQNADFSDSAKERVKKLAKRIPKDKLTRLIDAAIKRRQEIKQSPVPQLSLELLAVEFSDEMTPPTSSPKDNLPTPKGDAGITGDKTPLKNKAAESAPSVKAERQEDLPARKNSVLNLSPEETNNRWQQTISDLSADYPSLIFVLKMAEVAGLSDNNLHITFPYSFHKQKVEDKKIRLAIENILEKNFGQRINMVCDVVEGENKSNEADIATLAAEFGGEVIA